MPIYITSVRRHAGDLSRSAGETAGTRKGYEDLRRGATREHLVGGLVADLARIAAALGRNQDLVRLPGLRRILELEVTLQRGPGRER